MEESPEQVLARLIRYRDSLIRADQLPAPPARPHTSTPFLSEVGAVLAQSAVLLTLLGLFLAVVACVLGIVAFAELGAGGALVVVGVMTALGLAAVVRRVPVALWWTAGAVIGGILGLAS